MDLDDFSILFQHFGPFSAKYASSGPLSAFGHTATTRQIDPHTRFSPGDLRSRLVICFVAALLGVLLGVVVETFD